MQIHACIIMQFGMLPDFRVFQTRPGPSTEITSDLMEGQPWIDPTREAVITVLDVNRYEVAFYGCGIIIVVYSPYSFSGPTGEFFNYIQYTLKVPRTFSERTRGFFGNLDGDSTNELYRKGNTTALPNGLTDREIYNDLLTCKMTIICIPPG